MTTATLTTAAAIDRDQLPVPAQPSSTTLWDRVWPPAATFAGFIGLWYFASYVIVGGPKAKRIQQLPAPHEVISKGIFPLWDDNTGLRPILSYLWPTIMTALIGLAISLVLGTFFAVIMNTSKSVERAFFPYAVVIQTIPILALVPILTQWFGYAMKTRIIVTVLIAIFPVITNTLFGLQSAERAHHDLFTLNRVSRWTRLRKMEIPNALPAMLTGLRIATGGATIGAIVGDFFFTEGRKGIGYLIRNYSQKAARKPELFAATLIASLFGVSMFLIAGAIQSRALRNWHESARPRN